MGVIRVYPVILLLVMLCSSCVSLERTFEISPEGELTMTDVYECDKQAAGFYLDEHVITDDEGEQDEWVRVSKDKLQKRCEDYHPAVRDVELSLGFKDGKHVLRAKYFFKQQERLELPLMTHSRFYTVTGARVDKADFQFFGREKLVIERADGTVRLSIKCDEGVMEVARLIDMFTGQGDFANKAGKNGTGKASVEDVKEVVNDFASMARGKGGSVYIVLPGQERMQLAMVDNDGALRYLEGAVLQSVGQPMFPETGKLVAELNKVRDGGQDAISLKELSKIFPPVEIDYDFKAEVMLKP